MYTSVDDIFSWTDARKVLTSAELSIPSLLSFGCINSNRAGENISTHYHRDVIEIHFLAKGIQKFICGDTEYTLKSNDVLIAKPGVLHSTGEEPTSMCELYWLHVDMRPEGRTAFFGLPDGFSQQLYDKLSAMESVVYSSTEKTANLLRKAFSELSDFENGISAKGYIDLLSFVSEIAQLRTDGHRRSYPNIQTAVRYIDEHYSEDIALEFLSNMCRLSVSRFKTNFKAHTGVSPRKYINSKKIEYAKELLQSGKSVTQTAFLAGFNSSSYFSTVFKQFTAKAPEEYKNRTT